MVGGAIQGHRVKVSQLIQRCHLELLDPRNLHTLYTLKVAGKVNVCKQKCSVVSRVEIGVPQTLIVLFACCTQDDAFIS